MPSTVGNMTGIFNIVSLEIVLITQKKKKKRGGELLFQPAICQSLLSTPWGLGFAVVWLWFLSTTSDP